MSDGCGNCRECAACGAQLGPELDALKADNERLVEQLKDADKFGEDLLQANKRQRGYFDENQKLRELLAELDVDLHWIKGRSTGIHKDINEQAIHMIEAIRQATQKDGG